MTVKKCDRCGKIFDANEDNGKRDKKEDFRKLTDELIENMAKAESKAEQYKKYAEDLDKQNKTLVERIMKLERSQNGFDAYLELKAKKDKARIIELTAILDHYGSKAQSRQAVEELSELIQAICKCERMNYTFGECEDDPANLKESMNAYKNLLGEIADVIVMIEQLKIMVGARDRARIENIIDEKIKRQLDRIEKEKKAAENG